MKRDFYITALLVIGIVGIIFVSAYVLNHPHKIPVEDIVFTPALTFGTH